MTLHDRTTKSLLHLHKKKKPPSISAQFQVSSLQRRGQGAKLSLMLSRPGHNKPNKWFLGFLPLVLFDIWSWIILCDGDHPLRL